MDLWYRENIGVEYRVMFCQFFCEVLCLKIIIGNFEDGKICVFKKL